MLINDDPERHTGEFEFALHAADAPIDAVGPTLATVRLPFSVGALCLADPAQPWRCAYRNARATTCPRTARSASGAVVSSHRRFTVALPPPFLLGPGN